LLGNKNDGGSGRWLLKRLQHGVLAIGIKEFCLVDDEHLSMAEQRGTKHSAFMVSTTTRYATEHSLAQQLQRDVHLLAVAQLPTFTNRRQFFADDMKVWVGSCVNQASAWGVTWRAHGCPVFSRSGRIKENAGKFFRGSILPNTCWSMKYPRVVHMPTGECARKSLESP
jgi:hypothetical protein